MSLGKLVKSIGERCHHCNRSLQIREITEHGLTRRYKYCPNCDEELETLSDDRRARHVHKEHQRISGDF